MATAKLTKKQKELLAELDELSIVLGYDYQDAECLESKDRIAYLQMVKRRMINGELIKWYTLIDEFLSDEICIYFFGKRSRRLNYISLWKTQKFQLFNSQVIEKLSLLNKLEFVRRFKKIPNDIVDNVHRLNDSRNGIVHSFFPENRESSRPIYKKKDLYSLEGMKLLEADMEKVRDYFKKSIDYDSRMD